MQKKIIEYFNQITEIPHCSKKTDGLLKFLKEFGLSRGYSVEIDGAKNILIKKGKPKLALQAHYDMVCIGKAPKIETYIDNGWLKAKESSLGADNGIAIAIMMALIDMGKELEFLFTSDEEIGLIGASALNFELDSSSMLNIDFEDEAEVCIGCAGGADVIATFKLQERGELKYNYRVTVSGLQGGHSGLDIDKNIPNAIKLLVEYLKDKDVALSTFNGGERRNSIPTYAKATLSSLDVLKGNDIVKVEPLDDNLLVYESDKVINLLTEFKNGIHSYNRELNIPEKSVNLAIINLNNGFISIEVSTRAMSQIGIDEICKESIEFFKRYGFIVEEEYKYPAWRPEINSFTKKVYRCVESVFGKSEYRAIHAGLECGIISQRYPNIQIASIGPTISNPHSIREKVKIDSIEKIVRVILTLLSEYKK